MFREILRASLECFPAAARRVRGDRPGAARDLLGELTEWGFTFVGQPAEREAKETELVRSLLADVDELIHVGASAGYYTCHAASIGRDVVAIEPLAHHAHHLLQNLESNGWGDRVEVFPVAVGAHTGVREVDGHAAAASIGEGADPMHRREPCLVPVLPLDRVLAGRRKRRALIIVDVAGAELTLLDGALDALNVEPKPTWLMDVGVGVTRSSPSFAETFRRFFAAGYSAQALTETGLVPWTGEDVQRAGEGTQALRRSFLFRPAV